MKILLGERLKELRIEKNLSQAELAEAVYYSKSGINHWENNIRIPNAEAVAALASFFGVTSDYLLGLTDE